MNAAALATSRRRAGARSSAWIRPRLRWAIYVRDDFRCVWCGQLPPRDELTLDHLFPRAHRCRDNRPCRLVTACVSCNVSRKHSSVARWLRRLRADGADLGPIMRRLAVARYIPPNRRAGDRALADYRAELAGPPPLRLVDPKEIPF